MDSSFKTLIKQFRMHFEMLRTPPTDNCRFRGSLGLCFAKGNLLGVKATQILEKTGFLTGQKSQFYNLACVLCRGNRLPSKSNFHTRQNCSCSGNGARAISAHAGMLFSCDALVAEDVGRLSDLLLYG